MTVWRGGEAPPVPETGPFGWLRVILRGGALALVVYGGLALLLILRPAERWMFGGTRPVTPFITQAVCRAALAIIGMRYRVRGKPMSGRGAVVANHSSWLDIFTLNACQRIYFVSKSEVAGWAGIGWLARATGTAFIARDRREAKAQQSLFEDRIREGHRLLFFPEGTSTDGLRVLPFKSTLFAAFYTHGLDRIMRIQPVTVIYRAPQGADPRFYGWWGDMAFTPHLIMVLSSARQGSADVMFHDPVDVADFPSRKDLAAHCEQVIRTAHEGGTQGKR